MKFSVATALLYPGAAALYLCTDRLAARYVEPAVTRAMARRTMARRAAKLAAWREGREVTG